MKRHVLTSRLTLKRRSDTQTQRKPKPAKPQQFDLDPDAALLTIQQVARHLQLSTRTVRRHWHTGAIPPPIRLGSRLRWRLADLQQFIASQREVR